MCEIRKNSNNLTIQQKVFIYKFHARVYYCIHVERKGALDAFFAFFFCANKQSQKTAETGYMLACKTVYNDL